MGRFVSYWSLGRVEAPDSGKIVLPRQQSNLGSTAVHRYMKEGRGEELRAVRSGSHRRVAGARSQLLHYHTIHVVLSRFSVSKPKISVSGRSTSVWSGKF